MLGNFVTGVSVLAPAAMLTQLSDGLGVTIREASLLVTFGAMVLCIGSPLTAWLTSRFDRRFLLAATLMFMSAAHLASALAPNYVSLLIFRLVMLAVGALFTPQAAGTASMIVPPEKRGSTLSYVFLGWSLAAALGLPVITYVASHTDWRAAYGGIAVIALISSLLVAWRLPVGLAGVPVDIKTWTALGRSPLVVVLLLITTCQMAGQFVVFTFAAPLMARLTKAGPETIALVFLTWGAMGFIGNMLASRIVDSWGAWRSSLLFTSSLLTGVIGWAIGSEAIPAIFVAIAFWGFGFAATNSMQQVRLVAAAPPLASASVSLNTSVLYIGQGIGSAIGGSLYVRDAFVAMNYAAIAFVVVALMLIVLTKPRAGAN
ncbi:MFS transporter [Bradyrhizobium sp. SYSU BS000235]|uniref:MFS transporter n=1 Tax=Bradyrhizobium sp. SYSU BS000235 TaxID=3411332 RepID=UPI003C70F839